MGQLDSGSRGGASTVTCLNRSVGRPICRPRRFVGAVARLKRGRCGATLLTALGLALASLALLAPAGAADTIEAIDDRLPSPRAATSAVWDGDQAWVFGGVDEDNRRLAEVVRVDPANETVEVADYPMPEARSSPSSVWTGDHAYVFGGYNDGAQDEIFRFDPEDEVTVEVAELPSPRFQSSAVWTGEKAYIFGGIDDDAVTLDEIVVFDPDTEEAEVLDTQMPGRRSQLGTAWTGEQALLFAGRAAGKYPGQIWQFDPGTDAFTTSEESFFRLRSGTAATWEGQRAFVFGGTWGGSIFQADVLRYDPVGDHLREMSASFHVDHLAYASAVWMEEEGMVFGGCVGGVTCSGASDRVLAYDPSPRLPTPPTDVQAEPGPDPGQITLSWKAPDHPDNVTAYRVYAGPDEASLSLVAEFDADRRTYLEDGLADGETRAFAVTAVNSVGPSNRSHAASHAPREPTAPRELSVEPGPLLGELTLDWRAPSDDGGLEPDYLVYRHDGDGDLQQIARVDEPGYVDEGLPNGTSWTYEVTAVNEIGEGPASEPATETTPTVPTEPRNLEAEPGPGAGNVTLAWDPPEHRWGIEATYSVYRLDDGDARLLADGLSTRTYTEEGLEPEREVTYHVSAVNDLGEGPASEPATTISPYPPGSVQDLQARGGPDAGQINVTWSPPADDGGLPVGYRVERVDETGAQPLVQLDDRTAYVDTDLEGGSQHTYRVVSTNDAGEGPVDEQVQAEAATEPRAEDAVEVVRVGGTDPDPQRAVVRSEGAVEFVASANGLNPQAIDRCFSFRQDHGRTMSIGERYTVHFTYDSDTGALAASTDGGETYEECHESFVDDHGWAGVVLYRTDYYYRGGTGFVQVWPGPAQTVALTPMAGGG